MAKTTIQRMKDEVADADADEHAWLSGDDDLPLSTAQATHRIRGIASRTQVTHRKPWPTSSRHMRTPRTMSSADE